MYAYIYIKNINRELSSILISALHKYIKLFRIFFYFHMYVFFVAKRDQVNRKIKVAILLTMIAFVNANFSKPRIFLSYKTICLSLFSDRQPK